MTEILMTFAKKNNNNKQKKQNQELNKAYTITWLTTGVAGGAFSTRLVPCLSLGRSLSLLLDLLLLFLLHK